MSLHATAGSGLHTEVHGTGRPLVLAHGFTQNTGCWGPIGALLAATHRTVLVDAPGHGRSHHDDADLWEAGRLLADAGGRATYVGYSMGGRMALHAALQRPREVSALVLIGATAGLDSDAERAERRDADEVLAERLLAHGLPAFLDTWLAGPLFASLPASAACREERLRNRPTGLAASLRRCGTGNQEPLWDRLAAIEVPVLLLAGGLDTKFTAIAQRMAAAIGSNASVQVVDGAGHAVHSERPEEVSALITAFEARSVRLDGR